jgi:glycosyltransferase involved in cell wall biosynthesis
VRVNFRIVEEVSPSVVAGRKASSGIGVMHMVDSLAIGGAERVAVNLANLLGCDQYSTYLCTTRHEGPLAQLVAPHVNRLRLGRKRTLDPSAMRQLVAFIQTHNIRILHAHGTSLFFARMAGLFTSIPVIWHDHYGGCELNDRPLWPYRLAVRGIAAVITVNQSLASWSCQSLWISPDRVRYIPNLIDLPATELPDVDLPGEAGKRIVCVANIRPQKDHITLLRAMALVAKRVPAVHLILVGDSANAKYLNQVHARMSQLGLEGNVCYLGPRQDVPSILRACDVGVLSSISEGLPLALLEYGAAGLPVVVTNVGQCAEVVDNGKAGILIPCSNPEKLAEALLSLLSSTEYRLTLGNRLRRRVHAAYSAGPIVEQISGIYRDVLH